MTLSKLNRDFQQRRIKLGHGLNHQQNKSLSLHTKDPWDWYISLLIYLKKTHLNVGKYTVRPMDPSWDAKSIRLWDL